MINSRAVTMTPAAAARLLEQNIGNRRVSRTKVEEYKRQMVAGTWYLNGSTIGVSSTGVITDGQHRLIACVESGKSFPVILVQGLDYEQSFLTVDTGKSRSISDVLSIRGVKSSAASAAVIQALIRYERGNLGGSDKISNTEAEKKFNEHPLIAESVRRVKNFPSGLTYYNLMLVDYLGNIVNPVITSRFMEGVKTGANLPYGDPALALRTYLMNPGNIKNGGTANAYNRTFMCFKAFAGALKGKKVYVLKRGDAEDFPEVSGLPYGELIPTYKELAA